MCIFKGIFLTTDVYSRLKGLNSELRTQNHLFASFTSTIQSDSYTQMINDVKGMETCIKISNFDRYNASHQI